MFYILQNPAPEHVIQCYFDWCGSNTTQVAGVVAAARGQCLGTSVTQGYVRAYR